ncbi:unnamed protein product [Paramecium sonneborni]|uniref:Uncharacterized protein n=1 Tax=Paramecium sonneborni TaxID=65129 RepID=A0A8S1RR73_9CILI|nr:unnamed protein product [Paramecium sonneborni]
MLLDSLLVQFNKFNYIFNQNLKEYNRELELELSKQARQIIYIIKFSYKF